MSPLVGYKRVVSLIGLALATFLIVLDYTVANVSLPYIAGDLSVSAQQGTYIITSFAVGNAVILPLSGWLTERIGAVRLLLLSLLLFITCSWLCGSAPDYRILVVARFLQGFVAGPLIPLSQTLLIATNPPEKKTAVIAFWSMIVIAAPVIGPLLGGWISFDYRWPWIFYINIPFGLIAAACIYATLRPFETRKGKTPVDYIGFFFLAVAVTSLQIILDLGEQYDWLQSNYIRALAIVSALGFCYWIVWEKLHPHPLIHLSLLSIRSYAVSIVFIGIMYAMYFGSVVLIPLWLQLYMGYNSIWAGIAVAPIGIAPLFFSGFSGKIVNRYGILRPLALCFLLFAVASFYTSCFTTETDIGHIAFSRFLIGTGLILFITPLFALSMQDIPKEKLAEAAGLFHFVRAMSGGIGTAIFTTLWIRRTQFHHERIGSTITEASENVSAFLQTLQTAGIEGQQALGVTNVCLDKQAALLALNDCSYLMGILFLLLILLLPLGKKQKKLQGNQADISVSSSE